MKAAFRNLPDMTVILLDDGAKIDHQDNNGEYALFYAAAGGYLNVAKKLFLYNANPNLQTSYGETALIEAVQNKHQDVATLILDNGADPNKQDDAGTTALLFAADKNLPQMTKLLLADGASPEIKEFRQGNTPIILASEKGFS